MWAFRNRFFELSWHYRIFVWNTDYTDVADGLGFLCFF